MTSAIGLRVYRIDLRERGSQALLPLDSEELDTPLPEFISSFIGKHDHPIQNNELERSLYFEEKINDGPGSSRGYVHYGTYGFESNFVDTKTKKKKYRRQVSDVEEIPLFYEFWWPEGSHFALVAFQSFQGRSCITMVMGRLKEEFEKVNPDHILIYNKLMPNDAKGSAYSSSRVKQLRLIKRKTSSDLADQYFENATAEVIDFEVTISARRNGDLGPFSSLFKSIKSGPKSIISCAGIDFPEAIASIKVGKKLRRVGVLGHNGDAGVIDLTETIVRGPDGHPTFASLVEESNSILQDFYEVLDDAL
jgi:hypothetical protein